MSLWIRIAFLSLIVWNLAFAANPRPGWYAGVLIGGSYAPNVSYIFINPYNKRPNYLGEMHFSAMGNGAVQAGYRWNGLRLEGEVLYNYAPYHELTSGKFTFLAPKTSTGIRIAGNTSAATVFFNSYYDFYTPGSSSDWGAYVGVGIGYAKLWNNLKWYNNNIEISGTKVSDNSNSPAAQGIIGLTYFLDDFSHFTFDYRYYTTGPINLFDDARFQVHSINLSFNGMFNCA